MRNDITILLVEDDPPNRQVISKMLDVSGYAVVAAPVAGEALKILSVMVIHLVIIDIYLPGPSGIDLLLNIREMPDYRNVPAIAITANASNEARRLCEEAGFDHFLTKPLTRADLAAAVEAVMQ